MRLNLRTLFLITIIAFPLSAFAANQPIQGFCMVGGAKVVTSGAPSATYVQASYPKCQVTVYLTGTTNLATIYADGSNTPLANPFTANTNASWLFYASSGAAYDIVLSGGSPVPFPQPFTLTAVTAGGGGGGGGLNPGLQNQVVFYPANGSQGGPTNVQVDATTGNFLTAPNTNGTFNSDRYATGGGNNGISNLFSSTNCTVNGCFVARPQTSTDTESIPTLLNTAHSYTHGVDYEYGVNAQSVLNAGQNAAGVGQRNANTFTSLWNDELANTSTNFASIQTNNVVATNGIYVGSPWTIIKGHPVNMIVYTRSITQLKNNNLYAYHVGDTSSIYNYLHYRNGTIATNDEGTEGIVQQMIEDPAPYGTVVTGGQGASTVSSSFLSNGGNVADGLNLIDTSQVLSTGLLTGTVSEPGNQPNQVTTSDSHAVSTAIATLSGACGTNVARDTPISTTCGVTMISGAFTANAGDIVCVGDWKYPEHAKITAVGAGTITINLAYSHPTGMYVEQGGMCGGYIVPGSGISNPLSAHNFPAYFIAGSETATTMDVVVVYKGGQNGKQLVKIPSVALPISLGTITRTSNVVTATAAGGYQLNNFVAPSGAAITVAGASPSDLNGTVTGVTATPTTMSWSQTGANESGSGGTISVTGYNNYSAACGAETVKVLGVTINSNGFPNPNGTLSLEANNCRWTAGDGVVQPNHYATEVKNQLWTNSGPTLPIAQSNVSGAQILSAGLAYSGAVDFNLQSGDDISFMQGYGGISMPRTFVSSTDYFGTIFNLATPPLNGGSFLNIGCPPEGCGSNNFTYRLFQLSSNASGGGINGVRRMSFNPANGQFIIDNLSFSQQSATNITNVTGNGSSIALTSGTFTNGNLRCSDANFNEVDCGVPPMLAASLTTTAATSDTVTITGMTFSGHCTFSPTNVSAATNIATTYISAKGPNSVTITHTATAGMNYDILCRAN